MATAEPTELAALKMTVAKPSEEIERRVKELIATDAQFRAALPIASVNEAKLRPDLGLAQVVALIMEAYAARPALARRATEIVTDPATGSTTRRLLQQFETISYRELWSRARALANVWHHDDRKPLRANRVPLHSRVCWHRLCNRRSGCHPQRRCRRSDANERRHAAAVRHHQGSGAAVVGDQPRISGYRGGVGAHWSSPGRTAGVRLSPRSRLRARNLRRRRRRSSLRLAYPACWSRLPAAARARRRTAASAAVRGARNATSGMCTIYYTSGSTGLPKGAMYPELMVKPTWRVVSPIPFFYMHYMPMNHSFGRSGVFSTLGCGGTCYFTAQERFVLCCSKTFGWPGPTFMGIVPRICEMVYQQYQVELERRVGRVQQTRSAQARAAARDAQRSARAAAS